MIGEQLGRYKVIEEVGQGGMSVVYRGFDTSLKRDVAIKVLHPHLQNRAESRARFEREAQAVAKLSHPNVLQIYDFSQANSKRSYIVTELLHGQTLREFIESTPLEHPEIGAMIGVQLCDAVGHAHSLGIIHRDIKPENVMVCDDGTVKLMDFGIAQIVDAHAMTVTGTLLGSPAHMSPEMIEGSPLDFRADIFSMGTLIYFMVTGELPFNGPNPPLVLKAILEGNYDDAEMVNPRVGRPLSRIIDKCLELDAEDRYDSMSDLGTRLKHFLIDSGIKDFEPWLADFFDAPGPTQLRLRAHLLETLEERGSEALKSGRVAAALSYFNRVLAIEPEHERVLALIRSIDRRRKLYVYAGAAALLIVAGGVVAWASSSGPPAPPIDTGDTAIAAKALNNDVDAAQADKETAPSVLAEQTASEVQSHAIKVATSMKLRQEQHRALAAGIAELRVREVHKQAKRTGDAIKTAADAAAAANDRKVRPNSNNALDAGSTAVANVAPPDASTTPQETPDADIKPDKPLADTFKLRFVFLFPKEGVRVTINGTRYETAQLAAGVDLPRAKRLRFTAEHAMCKTVKGAIVPGDKEMLQKRIRMRFKPAVLNVSAGNDKGAFVRVYSSNGSLLTEGVVGKPIAIPINDPENPVLKLRIKVIPSLSGYKSTETRVSVTAGRPKTLSVNLNR